MKSRLPRMRGDRPQMSALIDSLVQFTPHARGSTLLHTGRDSRMHVYPACAGIDRKPGCLPPVQGGLPRMRGDRPPVMSFTPRATPFTPHARGSTTFMLLEIGLRAVYPACAGIDPVPLAVGPVASSLPRMRGDRPVASSFMSYSRVFTPHARGSTSYNMAVVPAIDVYPACAGIDRTRSSA